MSASATPTATPLYTLYQTSTFTVTAGIHTIEFLGMTIPPKGQSTAFIDDVTLAEEQNTFSDGNFEAPVLAGESYAVAPAGSAWQFSGTAGVAANLSGFTKGSGTMRPTGSQTAFIKDNGSISQIVYFLTGSYNISFDAAQRIGYRPQTIEVLVHPGQADQQIIGVFTPVVSTNPNLTTANITGNYYTYTAYQTSNFTVTAGGHTVEFLGMTSSTADCTALVDEVSIYAGCAINDGDFEDPALAARPTRPRPAAAPGLSRETPG